MSSFTHLLIQLLYHLGCISALEEGGHKVSGVEGCCLLSLMSTQLSILSTNLFLKGMNLLFQGLHKGTEQVSIFLCLGEEGERLAVEVLCKVLVRICDVH